MPLNFIAKAAITVAMTALNYAITASQKIEGPRLDETKVTLGDYGVALPMVWGTRRIDGPPIFFAEDLREVKRRRKTKGGKYNEYTYFGTWAMAVAGHEIEDVTRIWLDKKLVYDVTGAGPIYPLEDTSGNTAKSMMPSDYMRIYKGTEDQEADPRMLATVEAAQGVGSCPAYRGTAYVMFSDVPLEKFGNRIPQAAVEIVSAKTAFYPVETFPTIEAQPARMQGAVFSDDGSRFMWGDTYGYEIWDTVSRTRIAAGNFSSSITAFPSFAMFDSGNILVAGGNVVYRVNSEGRGGLVYATLDQPQDEVRIRRDGNGRQFWFTIPYSSLRTFYIGGQPFTMLDLTGVDWAPVEFFENPDEGSIWAVGRIPGTSSDIAYFRRVIGRGTNPPFLYVTGLPAQGIALGGVNGCYSNGAFILQWGGALHKINPVDGSILDTLSGLTFDPYNTKAQFNNFKANSDSLWVGATEINLIDLSIARTVTLANWDAGDASGIIYDRINHALITAPQYTQEVSWRYLDRVAGSGVPLSEIAGNVADMCGVPEYDFSDLSQTVGGWSATIGAGQDILEPLLDAYDVDIRPHDFTIEGIVRGGASGGTIDVERFVRSGDEPRYNVKIAQAAQIPRAMVMNFADIDKDQQVNSVRVSRPPETTDAAGEATLDMTTWATDTDSARQYLARYFRRIWNGREMINNALTPQNLSLEPADLRTLGLDGENVLARLIKTSLSKDGKMTSEWVTDDPDLALLDGGEGPTFDGYVPSELLIPLPSRGFVIDANLATDLHDQSNPFLYYAAAPYTSGFWPGVDFATSDGGTIEEYLPGWASVPSSSSMDWGWTNNMLGNALPGVLDYGNTLNVNMCIGTLSGLTEAEILADSELNLLLIEAEGGWEYVQFVDADLQGDGSYNVTGLLRGRRGTEHLIGAHAAGNAVIVVDGDVLRRSIGASEIGDTDYFRAVTQGRSLSSAVEQEVTFTAAANKPYSAANGALSLASGDWSITADRRTRIGGSAFLSGPLPLGEASESWEADILNGVDVVRTISGSSLPLVYTEEQQVVDFGTAQTSLEVNLYQLNPVLALRGYPLNITA